jgi:hypothetical protein
MMTSLWTIQCDLLPSQTTEGAMLPQLQMPIRCWISSVVGMTTSLWTIQCDLPPSQTTEGCLIVTGAVARGQADGA